MPNDTPETTPSGKVKKAGEDVKKAAGQAKDAAKNAGDFITSGIDSIGDLFGGFDELDKTIKRYNPTFARFVEKSFLKNISSTNKPSKFLMCLILIGIAQSLLPIFQWPLDFLSRILGFVFLYTSGLEELKTGFASSKNAMLVKSFLTVFLCASAWQLIPTFLFDTVYHFGALWNFFMPVVLFITPSAEKPDETLAVMLCDSVFAALSQIIQSLLPDPLKGDNASFWVMVACAGISLLLWVGYLGATGSYVAIWAFLAFTTIDNVGQTYVTKDVSGSGYTKQQTIWHNLLAMWLWRYLVSTVEGLTVPGLISVSGLILFYLPSYFLWMTAFFAGMLFTKKTASSASKADTWYARWLMGGGLVPPKKASTTTPPDQPSSSTRQSSRSRK